MHNSYREATHRINDPANHRVAPVRRETEFEAFIRAGHQIPCDDGIRRMVAASPMITVNKGLIPGKAKFIKVISKGA